MPRWERWGPVLLIGAYLCGILILSRGVTNEDWDGIKAINNGLLAARAGGPDIPLDLQRPPLGWLLMSPWLAAAYRRGGAHAALRLAHGLWPLYLGLLLAVSLRWLRGRQSLAVAATAMVLMAFNPILIQFAPFALMDIFSGLALVAFLVAARRYLDQPGGRQLGLLAAAYAAAFLSKYHLGLLILVPLAFRLVDAPARRLAWPARLLRFVATPLWVLPAACGVFSLLVLAALAGWAHGGAGAPLRHAWRELGTDFAFNLLTPKESHWSLYVVALAKQLGQGLVLLMAFGVWRWLKEDGDEGRWLSLALLIPYAALSFFVSNKEARYAIPLLPVVYAAVARGIQAALAPLPPGRALRGAALAGCLALVPWSGCLAAARYLAEEPSIHTPVPWDLASRLESASPSPRCVGWSGGDLDFQIRDPLFRYENTLIVGAPTFKFFTRLPVKEASAKAASDCPWRVVARDGPGVGRVYEGQAPRWDIFPGELRAIGEK